MVMEQHEPVRHGCAAPGSIAVDTLRDAMIANFEKEDLDVPAFLRKRERDKLVAENVGASVPLVRQRHGASTSATLAPTWSCCPFDFSCRLIDY